MWMTQIKYEVKTQWPLIEFRPAKFVGVSVLFSFVGVYLNMIKFAVSAEG